MLGMDVYPSFDINFMAYFQAHGKEINMLKKEKLIIVKYLLKTSNRWQEWMKGVYIVQQKEIFYIFV